MLAKKPAARRACMSPYMSRRRIKKINQKVAFILQQGEHSHSVYFNGRHEMRQLNAMMRLFTLKACLQGLRSRLNE